MEGQGYIVEAQARHKEINELYESIGLINRSLIELNRDFSKVVNEVKELTDRINSMKSRKIGSEDDDKI